MRAVAIVNAHARRLRGRLASRLERALPGGVRLTHSLDEARAVLRDDVRRGVDLVAFAGGDGTIVMGLSLLAEACRGAGKPEPCVGVLRLGSGNAIADAVGASKDPAEDLAQLAAGRGTWRAIPLIETLGVRAPFVGVGVDAQLLEDHATVGRALDRVPGVRRLGPGSRYVLSVGMRSIPRFALTHRPLATVTNLGSPAAELGPRAGSVRPTGAPLWSGACTLVAGATMP